MDTNIEDPVNQIIEHFRRLYAKNLNKYLQAISKNKRSILSDKGYKDRKPHNQSELEVYDEKGKINWQIIRRIIPADIEKHIQKAYSMLSENEIRLCCLLIFDVPPKTIDNILKFSQNTIYVTTSKIKKKTGLKDFKEIFRKINLNSTLTEK
jgi:DNA-binding CsgD family transcriptional regulator